MIAQFFFISTCFILSIFANTAVTYDFSGGRFGDNVLTYLHAKWLSYEYNIPLLYKPFSYSDALKLDQHELRYCDYKNQYGGEISLGRNYPRPIKSNAIYVCPYFPEIEWELKKDYYFTFNIDWKNKKFREMTREMIAPKDDLVLTWPPKDSLSVAIHMREGGGFDDEDHKIKHPLKTPPATFYSASLKKVLELFPGKELYCYVFTDAIDPQSWINKIISDLPLDYPITFNFRSQDNRHDSNVLEDFFSLFNFDILIRAESNYSIVPSLIHDYAVVCYPKKYSIQGRVVTIDEIKVEIDENLFQRCLKK